MSREKYSKIATNDFQNRYCNYCKLLVDEFENEKINYFAIYGTLLGAIREKDMIPWDNDIDLAVYRNDLGKLKNIINRHKDIFYLKTFEKSEEIFGIVRVYMKSLYRKISIENNPRNAYFDLYIFDFIDEEKQFFKLKNKNVKYMNSFFFKKSDLKPNNCFKRFLKPIVQFLIPSCNWLTCRMLKNYNKNIFGDKLIGFMMPEVKHVYPVSKIEYADYHGYKIKIPQNFNLILTLEYGENYMIPYDRGMNNNVEFYINLSESDEKK